MKNKLLMGSALLVLSTSAFASTARLISLGMNETDYDGVYYIEDARNVFMNPAYINMYTNRAVLEYGNYGKFATASTSTTTTEAAATTASSYSATTLTASTSPKAQGGYFKKVGDYNFGVYLGNESNTSSLLRIAATSAASAMNGYAGSTSTVNSRLLQSTDNQVDLFMGGDMGSMKWGANVLGATGKDDSRTGKNSAAAIKYGLIGSNWNAHLNLSLLSKSVATDTVAVTAVGITSAAVTEEFKGKLGAQLGGAYKFEGSGQVFGWAKRFSWEQSDTATYNGTSQSNGIGGQNGTVKGDFTAYYLGFAKDMNINPTDKVWVSVAAKKTDINLNFTNKSEVRHLILPVSIAFESKANEWLTVRGSVVQNLWSTRSNKNVDNTGTTGTQLNKIAQSTLATVYGSSGKGSIANSTAVNAGATLTFGNLSIDGLVGTTSGDRTSTDLGTGTNKGVLALDNLMTSVGMNYTF
jgi:hypothetical protein